MSTTTVQHESELATLQTKHANAWEKREADYVSEVTQFFEAKLLEHRKTDVQEQVSGRANIHTYIHI